MLVFGENENDGLNNMQMIVMFFTQPIRRWAHDIHCNLGGKVKVRKQVERDSRDGGCIQTSRFIVHVDFALEIALLPCN